MNDGQRVGAQKKRADLAMIEMFQEVKIPVARSGFDTLVDALKKTVALPWSFEKERKLDGIPGGTASSFSYRGGALPDANLSLAWYSEQATIGNT